MIWRIEILFTSPSLYSVSPISVVGRWPRDWALIYQNFLYQGKFFYLRFIQAFKVLILKIPRKMRALKIGDCLENSLKIGDCLEKSLKNENCLEK